MNRSTITTVVGLSLALILGSVGAHAAGFNYVTPGNNPVPLTWDTSAPIPVYTDGGEAFTFDYDNATPFITIERANEITQFGYDQWNAVPTSTLVANVAGTIEDQTGIADVTGANATDFYGVENGYGIWVLYDTDGSILEDYFGVPKEAVLGVAFPEFAAGSEIVEATVVLNGWFVYDDDTEGNMVAGVFTHEFGHTLNLSHTQVNGHMAYYSYTYAPLYPGVEGCGVEPVHRYDYPPTVPNRANPDQIETMYPFIDHGGAAGEAMSYVTMPDDIAALSDLYPTADYHATTGSISGTLYLKDEKTEFSGINIIARSVSDPMGDAVSAVTGHLTQGQVGPDGSFIINNLTPGEEYVLYTEEIVAGGWPLQLQRLISVPEYWNEAESANPIDDDPCDATPIVAEAGVTTSADLIFNGYIKGVDFTPIVEAFLVDLAKNGRSSLGLAGTQPFIWDQNGGFTIIDGASSSNGQMTRNGQKILTNTDLDGDGIGSAAIWTAAGGFTDLGYLGDGQCGGSSSSGVDNSIGIAMSDNGNVAVGMAYWDKDGDGNCQRQYLADPEITAWVWTRKTGMQELPLDGLDRIPPYVRAQAISGNGQVILGRTSTSQGIAWVNGELVDLYAEIGASEALAVNYDGTRVALQTSDGVVLWNPFEEGDAAFENIGSFRWCYDLPYNDFLGRNYCDLYDWDFINDALGPVPVLPFDMTDDGSIIIGRGGTFFAGLLGAFWSEPTGWMTWEDFFAKQGVVEAATVPFDNPISISASGSEVVGGIAGSTFSWLVNIDQVYVCMDGQSIQTGFPNGMFNMLAQGAVFGRCEHLDD